MLPIRCFTCGKVMKYHKSYCERVNEKKDDPKKVLDELGYSRYCCRAIMMTSLTD